MISSRPVFHLLKVTLEAKSAHAIHTGHGDTVHDSLVVRDANGLPTLSGSSLAGVLRHAYQRQYGEAATQALFGYANGQEGQTSWLSITWGLTHNSHNQAQEGLLTEAQLSDELYQQLSDDKLIVRQRVRLNDKGSSMDAGKFDVTLVPAGTRYSFNISYWGESSEQTDTQWNNLLKLLTAQDIRIGHGTNSGYGLFDVVALHQAVWDLTTEAGQANYCQHDRARMNYKGMETVSKDNLNDSALSPLSAVLDLTAESGWRVGGGERYLETESQDERAPDMLPMHEAKIYWHTQSDGKQTAKMGSQQYLLPASAIKGAIRHRVAYHYNCLTQRFVDDDTAYDADDSPAVTALFGQAKDKQASAGILAFQDVYLENQQHKVLTHNKIDKFTSGVINGALFSEQVLWQSRIKVQIDITKPEQITDMTIKQALQNALSDLAKGWLPLGASGSRGLGAFLDNTDQGIQWSDSQMWISTQGAA